MHRHIQSARIADFVFEAGYSVMTYVLGVGDRHLENLLLAPDGKSSSLL